MARASRDEETEAVSLRSKDAFQAGGLFGPGPATIKSACFDDFEYKKKGERRGTVVPVMLITFERDDEEREQPYGIGSGWGVHKDGQHLIPRNGQKSLPDNCNATYFIEALERAGMPEDYLVKPEQLDGVEVVLIKKAVDRDFGDKDKDKRGGGGDKSILVVGEVVSAHD